MPKKKTATEPTQTTLPFPSADAEHLDISTLETWLLDAANTIRGASDAPKFKDFILPLISYKRLSDVFDDEFAKQIEEFGNEELAREIVHELVHLLVPNHGKLFKGYMSAYLPDWEERQNRLRSL